MTDREILELLLNKFVGFEIKVNTMETKIDKIEADVSVLKTDVSILKTDVSVLKVKVNNIEKSQKIMEQKMDAITGKVAELIEFKTETNQRFDVHETDINMLKRKVG